MKIETKHNIGDVVWVLQDNQIMPGIISEIAVSVGAGRCVPSFGIAYEVLFSNERVCRSQIREEFLYAKPHLITDKLLSQANIHLTRLNKEAAHA